MKIDKQIDRGHDKLLLIFSGWSASPELFNHIEPGAETDLWICYDYRDLRLEEDLSAYREIRIIAWSLGVWVASVVCGERDLPITEAVAINGTPYPIHDQWGIPEALFLGTLNNITEEGMRRFNRRMCGKRELLQAYEQRPQRPLEEIREELQQLYYEIKVASPLQAQSVNWTRAFVASEDRIFPAANLRAFWQGRCPMTQIDAPHYPFYLWTDWNEIWS